MNIYNTLASHLRKKYGEPVRKIPINGGFSCPNRDGTIGSGGCVFCDARSFSPVALSADLPLSQLRDGIRKSAGRYKKFIAYLQPWSNTYASVDILRSIYEPLIAEPGVVGLAVGTRPDCLPNDVLEYLADVAQRTDLTVELGLQSSNNAVLEDVNRGHSRDSFVDAVRKLHERTIEVVAHVMLGLPGESIQSMIQTADLLTDLHVEGVKIHQLMIIEDTPLAERYHTGEVSVFSIEEYADVLGEFIEHLGKDMIVHRIMADATKETGLIAPAWCEDKRCAMGKITALMDEKGIVQGSKS